MDALELAKMVENEADHKWQVLEAHGYGVGSPKHASTAAASCTLGVGLLFWTLLVGGLLPLIVFVPGPHEKLHQHKSHPTPYNFGQAPDVEEVEEILDVEDKEVLDGSG